MKIKLTETQLRKILNEVGGYDSSETMASHAGTLHGEINFQTIDLINMVGTFIEDLRKGEIDKDKILIGTFNLNSKIEDYVKRMNELKNEIFIDDDFKALVSTFLVLLKKVQKYFQLLVNLNHGTGMSGIGVDMGKTELTLEISKRLASLGPKIEKMGEMIAQLVSRFKSRMN